MNKLEVLHIVYFFLLYFSKRYNFVIWSVLLHDKIGKIITKDTKLIMEMSLEPYYYILEHIGRLARMSVLDTEVDGSNPGSSMLFH